MKIKGWEKISGYTYKGYSIVNPIHNADETMYEATILNLNLPQNPKWELNVLTPAHKWKNDDGFSIILRDDENRSTINTVDKVCMASISIFRQTFEEMIDKVLGMRLTSAPRSSSINVNTTSGGILSTINTNSNTIQWNPTTHTNLPTSMIDAMQELQKQIDELKAKV